MTGAVRRGLAWASVVTGVILVTALALMTRERLAEEWAFFRLRSSSTSARLGAIDSLGRFDNARVITALYNVANDRGESPRVREAAARSLERVVSQFLEKNPWEHSTDLDPHHAAWVSARLKQPDT